MKKSRCEDCFHPQDFIITTGVSSIATILLWFDWMGLMKTEEPEASISRMDNLRILHVITRMSVGGAQENTLLTVEGLQQIPGFEVELLSGTDDGSEGDLLPRARCAVPVLIVPELFRAISPVHDLKAFVQTYRLIRRGRYHIVHTHMSKAGVIGRWAAKLAGTPIIVHTLHSLVFHPYQPWIVNRGWRLIKKICAPITDFYISVSSRIADAAVEAGIAPAQRIRTIYSGMELDWFLRHPCDQAAARKRWQIPADAPVAGMIARLFPLKGHRELLAAAPELVRRHPEIRFLLIGDGSLRAELEAEIRRLGLERNFILAGMLDREEIPDAIAAMDLLVHTSLREGLARVLVQALAMRRPCVAFNLDGAPEVVLDGETGFLVEPADKAGLVSAVSRLVENPDLRRRLGEAGRARVDPAFQAHTMVRQIADLYRELAGAHKERIARFDWRYNRRINAGAGRWKENE